MVQKELSNDRAIARLTALWALNEAGLGGFMHALKIPFTGILIGGFAIILITLIAHFSRGNYGSILKSTMIVVIIKGIASPHSPINAYIAVFFQGITGFALFSVVPHFSSAAILLGLLSLLESSLQRVLVLTLIYGMSLWHALDLFVQHILKLLNLPNSSFSFSRLLIGAYIGLHALAGIFTGWLGVRFSKFVQTIDQNSLLISLAQNNANLSEPALKKKKKKSALKRKILKVVVLALLIFSTLFFFSAEGSGLRHAIFVLIRVLVLLSLWYLLLGPFLMKWLHIVLKKKSAFYQKEIQSVLDILPVLTQAVKTIWREAVKRHGVQKWKFFLSQLIVFALVFDSAMIENIKD